MKDFIKTSQKQYKIGTMILMGIVTVIFFSQLMLSDSVVPAQMNSSAPDESVDNYAALSNAIGRAPTDGTPYTIAVTGDIIFTGAITITNGKNVTIESDSNGPWKLIRNSGSGSDLTSARHFLVNGSSTNPTNIGTLMLKNIVLDGSGAYGGINVGHNSSSIVGGILYLNNGAVIQNCSNTNAANGGGITIYNGGSVIVNGGKISSNKKNMTNGGGGVYMQSADSSFTMNHGTISDNTANTTNSYGGGIASFGSGTININGGEIYGNTSGTFGGGINASGSVKLNITGGEIYGNEATTNGGGVYGAQNSTITITGGKIIGNEAKSNGGGIYAIGTLTVSNNTIDGNTTAGSGGGIYASSAFTISDSIISGNNATSNGGGIYGGGGSIKISNSTIGGDTEAEANTAVNGGGIFGYTNNSITINSSAISGNKATTNGGGIYIVANSRLDVTDESQITGNNAVRGGGIYTASTDYSNLSTASSTIFSGNRASAAYTPPENAETLYPDIKFEKTSITVHPLNNFDINYIGKSLTFTLTYNANGGTGSYTVTDIVPGVTIKVLSSEETGISRKNHYTFIGWNTKEDGSGTGYQPGDDITILDDITLYAQWMVNEYTVSFESNGGSPVEPQTVAYGGKALEPVPPTKESFTFAGWYVDDGTFENTWDFDTNTVTSDLTLYAQWTVTPAPSEPSEPTPTEPLPSEPVTSEPLPSELVPSETAPPEPVPSESVPPEPVPSESSSESVPLELVPSEPVPFEPVPSESVPFEPVPSEPVPSEPVPSELVQSEPVTSELPISEPEPTPEIEDQTEQNSPKTGDSFNLEFWISLLCISFSAIVILVRKERRQ